MTDRGNKSLAIAILSAILICSGCRSTSRSSSEPSVAPDSTTDASATKGFSAAGGELADAMDKLEKAIEKPASPFHISFEKRDSDGFSYHCEADVSSQGIFGKQTDVSPTTHVGSEVFPASTRVRELKGAPFGSPDWSMVRTGIVLTFMNGHIGDAQAGVRYVADESAGGYDARRYNFDLTGVSSDAKTAMTMGNTLMPGERQLKGYNVKGSAWIAKSDGRIVKFNFDSIMLFSNGEDSTTHYEGVVSKK